MVKALLLIDGEEIEETHLEASGVNLTANGDLLIVAPIPSGPPQGGKIIRCVAAGQWIRATAEENVLTTIKPPNIRPV